MLSLHRGAAAAVRGSGPVVWLRVGRAALARLILNCGFICFNNCSEEYLLS